MMWVTHVLFGILLYMIGVFFKVFPFDVGYLILAAISSLMPDIDHPGSKISKSLRASIISRRLKHRGAVHSLYALVIFSLATYGIMYYLMGDKKIAFELTTIAFLGYFSHLLIDSLNPTGVRWLYPKALVRGPIKTGSLVEVIVFFLISLSASMLYLKSVALIDTINELIPISLGVALVLTGALGGEIVVRTRQRK